VAQVLKQHYYERPLRIWGYKAAGKTGLLLDLISTTRRGHVHRNWPLPPVAQAAANEPLILPPSSAWSIVQRHDICNRKDPQADAQPKASADTSSVCHSSP
jgi:hypothetical protein